MLRKNMGARLELDQAATKIPTIAKAIVIVIAISIVVGVAAAAAAATIITITITITIIIIIIAATVVKSFGLKPLTSIIRKTKVSEKWELLDNVRRAKKKE